MVVAGDDRRGVGDGDVDPPIPDGATALRATATECWPRALIASGRAERLAAYWRTSLAESAAAGLPPFARHAWSERLADALYEARRARRLVRGLEGAEAQLASEAVGLRARSRATAPGVGEAEGEASRLSRLLVVTEDGAPRFYRAVESLRRRHAGRLEVLVLACDEVRLGERLFGRGRRARAVLIAHKESLVRFGEALWSGLGEVSDSNRPE